MAPAMLAALEGTRVYVHGNVQLPGNSRGVLGVVDAEYTVLDGDEVRGTRRGLRRCRGGRGRA